MQKENTPPAFGVESPRRAEEGHEQLKSPTQKKRAQQAQLAREALLHRRAPAASPVSSSSQSKAAQAAARRRAAAEWVESMTGIALPTSSDTALRGALRDGVVLCKVLNILRPGIFPKVTLPNQGQHPNACSIIDKLKIFFLVLLLQLKPTFLPYAASLNRS